MGASGQTCWEPGSHRMEKGRPGMLQGGQHRRGQPQEGMSQSGHPRPARGSCPLLGLSHHPAGSQKQEGLMPEGHTGQGQHPGAQLRRPSSLPVTDSWTPGYLAQEKKKKHAVPWVGVREPAAAPQMKMRLESGSLTKEQLPCGVSGSPLTPPHHSLRPLPPLSHPLPLFLI